MNLILHEYLTFALVSLAQAILVAIILTRGAAKRWPFLLALCIFDLIHGSLLFRNLGDEHYKAYFYIFWIGLGLRCLLTLGLLWDVIRSLPTLKYLPKRIGVTLFAFGLAVTFGAIFITTRHHPETSYLITTQVLMIRQCVTLAWVCFAGTLLWSISLLGLGWEPEPMNITAGFAISGLASMLTAALMSSWPKSSHAIDQFQTCIEIAVLLYWSVVLCRISMPDASLSDSALNVVNEPLEE